MLPSGTLTFLFTDLERSTALWEQQTDSMHGALARHDELVAGAIEAHGGHVIKRTGDGFHAVFATAPAALAGAVGAQHALEGELWTTASPLRARMGLHTGVAEQRGDDYYGPVLNEAARLMDAGHGGQILVSRTTWELVRDALPEGCELIDLGEHRLKGVSRPMGVGQVAHRDLPRRFPPLRLPEVPGYDLPVQLSTFVGREAELDWLENVLAEVRLLTLTGSGGCGKTRLGLELAGRVSAPRDHGACFVDLAPVSDARAVPSTIAGALGLRDDGRRTLDQITDYLQDRDTVLVVDNCEHVIAAAADAVGALLMECATVTVVATSREPLGVAGETAWRVPGLSVPERGRRNPEELREFEAVQLFVDRAVKANPRFTFSAENASDVAEVCERLDGIPLAIELAAARVRMLSARQIRAGLSDRLHLLTGGARTAVPRQQTLRASVDWSVGLLGEGERCLLARLSVFTGGFSLDAARGVATGGSVGDDQVLDLLSGLVDRSLVQTDDDPSEVRYRFLETIREYAAEQLAGRGDHERLTTHRRHRDYFLSLTEAAAPELHSFGALEWSDRLEREHDNIRSALGNIDADPSDEATDAGLRIITAAAHFWVIRSHILEASERADRILARPQPRTSPLTRAAALLAAAELDAASDHHQRAKQRLYEALALARRHGDNGLTSGVLEQLGYEHRLDPARAREFVEESLDVARAAGSPHRVARALASLGMIVGAQGDDRSARQLFGEAVALFRKLGDREYLGNALNNLGVLLMNQGDLVEARAALEEACVAQSAIGSSPSGPSQNLATIALLEGDAEIAERMFAKCLTEARRDGHQSGTAYAFLGCALSATLREDFYRAAALHGVADVVIEQAGQPFEDLESRLRTADLQTLHRALGDAAWQQSYEHGRQLSTTEAAGIVLAPPEDDGSALTLPPDA